MRYVLPLGIAFLLGALYDQHFTFIRQNCDTTKYSDMWESLYTFKHHPSECLNSNVQIAVETRPEMVSQLIKLKLGLK